MKSWAPNTYRFTGLHPPPILVLPHRTSLLGQRLVWAFITWKSKRYVIIKPPSIAPDQENKGHTQVSWSSFHQFLSLSPIEWLFPRTIHSDSLTESYLVHTVYSWSDPCWSGSSPWDRWEARTGRPWDSSTQQHRGYRKCCHCWHSSLPYTTPGWNWHWNTGNPPGRGCRLCSLPKSSNHCCKQHLWWERGTHILNWVMI